MDRRAFIRVATGSVLAAGAAGATGCDLWSIFDEDDDLTTFFAEDFASRADSWGERWLNFRYEGSWARSDGAGVVVMEPGARKAVSADFPQTEYMAQPMVVPAVEASEVRVVTAVEVRGEIEAGPIARASFDQSYALLVGERQALLCRYGTTDRTVLDRAVVPRVAGVVECLLTVHGSQVEGRLRTGERDLVLGATDPDPLPRGMVGVLVNPVGYERGGTARFSSFRAAARGEPPAREPRFLYRFAGGVVPDGDGTFRARLSARTVVPEELIFEVSGTPSFDEAVTVGPLAPEGSLGGVRAWVDGLRPGTEYHWRPVARSGEGRVAGPAASFATPPGPGEAVQFVFGSCTSGRVDRYPSFARAADHSPHFYVHAGDWGYADLNAVARRADHFQARWIRLLRAPEVGGLVARTPLLFWQDDHDYQADNGWAATVQPYAVAAFDELHANPTDDYFDVRWGDVHVWCLDCRLFASDPAAPDDGRKTRLGARQKEWLRKGMSASDAPVQVVASAMAFRDKVPEDPGWHNVYATERDELLGFFAGLDATVVILSGDSHGQRLIHHFEFGELFEITSSGTDFPPGAGQGRNDLRHTLVYDDRSGFAVVSLDPVGPERKLTVTCVASDDGTVMFEKSLPAPG